MTGRSRHSGVRTKARAIRLDVSRVTGPAPATTPSDGTTTSRVRRVGLGGGLFGADPAGTVGRLLPLACAVIGGAAFLALTDAGRDSRSMAPVKAGLDRFVARAGAGLDQVEVSGARLTPIGDIFAAVDADGARSLAGVDPDAIRARILTSPFVRTAQVTRIWPDRLEISVTEREPYAVAIDQDHPHRGMLHDSEGTALAAVTVDPAMTLPRVVGADSGKRAGDIVGLLSAYPSLMADVERSELVGARRWTLHLRSGGAIALPEIAPEGALQLAVAMGFDGRIGPDIVVDLRSPGRIVLRRNAARTAQTFQEPPQRRDPAGPGVAPGAARGRT